MNGNTDARRFLPLIKIKYTYLTNIICYILSASKVSSMVFFARHRSLQEMRTLLILSICLVMVLPEECFGQFFTKTTKNIPKMGRSDKMLPNLVHRVARTLHFVIKMVEDYDADGDGELDPEELMDVPFIQNYVKNYNERESNGFQTNYQIPDGIDKDSESSTDQRMIHNEQFLM